MNSEAAYYAQSWWPLSDHAKVLATLETLDKDRVRWAPLVDFIDRAVIQDTAWDGDDRVRARAPLQLAPCDMMAWCRDPPTPTERVMRFAAMTWGMPCHWIRDTPLRREACAQQTPWAKSVRAVLLRLDQVKDVMWWFIRRFWVGASNLSGVLRMQDAWLRYEPYGLWRTPVHVWAEITGRVDKTEFGIDGKRAAEHGKIMEGLPRDMCAEEFDQERYQLIEVGSIIVQDAAMGVYTQSPDGLIVPRGTNWPWGLDRDPYDPEVHAYDDRLLASIVTVCEFKCQWLKRHAYTYWPDGYVPQIAQAMRAFHVKTARVCAVYYVPVRRCPLFGEYWLRGHREDRCEWMSYDIGWDDEAMAWFSQRMDEFAKWVVSDHATGDEVQAWHLEVVVGTGRTERGTCPEWSSERRHIDAACPPHLGHVGPFIHVMDRLPRTPVSQGGWRDMSHREWAQTFLSTHAPLDARYALECQLRRLEQQRRAATSTSSLPTEPAHPPPFPEAHLHEKM